MQLELQYQFGYIDVYFCDPGALTNAEMNMVSMPDGKLDPTSIAFRKMSALSNTPGKGMPATDTFFLNGANNGNKFLEVTIEYEIR